MAKENGKASFPFMKTENDFLKRNRVLGPYRWHDELVCKQAYGWEDTVCQQGQRCEGIDGRVYVREPLEPLEVPTLVTVPDWAMMAEEDLDRSKSPPEDLVEPIRQVNGSRSLECCKFRHTVDGSPTPAMHLESC